MKKILFNKVFITGKEINYIQKAINSEKICGDGNFTLRCNSLLEKYTGTSKALLTTSCTHALEMTALLCDIKENDEVIMPSYTFVSTANAFVLRGAKIVFVDIDPSTMNIDVEKITAAITRKTKAIVCVHYACVGCEMDELQILTKKYGLTLIEDAAQGVMAFYKSRPLGTFGSLGCFSFHETKNIHCGEGGALLINDQRLIDRAEIIREKGTNRRQFIKGKVCKYSWVGVGSSYLPSELNAAFLLAHLEQAKKITQKRLHIWNAYYKSLLSFEKRRLLELPKVPAHCAHNGHTFFIKLKDASQRHALIKYLKNKGIASAFHYIPLHSALAGKKYGRFSGVDLYTTRESERLLRLPLYVEMTARDISYIVKNIGSFFNDKASNSNF